jgi:predicted GNAT family N-acyltransferase
MRANVIVARIGVDLSQASDGLRSELIFLPDDGSVTRIECGDCSGFVILTPSNTGYWWGNSLRFDHAPRDEDFDGWMKAFETHVHAVQPASKHRTFGWDGEERGDVDRFVAAGFEYFQTIGVVVDRGETVVAPHFNRQANIVRIAGDDWTSLLRLLVDTRDPKHSEEGYIPFSKAQIVGWQDLEAKGQGCWFGVRDGGRIVAALGIFVEARRGTDGRRIGRFQQVVTDASVRRQGLCGTLVEHASRFAFEQLDADALRISADANDLARRVYESCGYRVRSRHHGLERES